MNSQKKITQHLKLNEEALEKGPASVSSLKPNIFHYHDYVQFLNDWMVFQKKNQKRFSLRQLAGKCRISVGYLPMVLSGQRPLSQDALDKLIPEMRLTKSEQIFFEAIHSLGTTSSQSVRAECLNQMRRYSAYREHFPNESEVYRYLTKWYFSAIRELSADPEFKLDGEWIQSRLREHVPLAEIKEALAFLVDHKYVIISEAGTVAPPEKHLSCEGGIYKVALTEYHRQFLSLSEKSIENVESTNRHLIGHTFAVSEKKFEIIQELLKEVVVKIQAITNEKNTEPRDTVYHLEMALFPLTLSKEKK